MSVIVTARGMPGALNRGAIGQGLAAVGLVAPFAIAASHGTHLMLDAGLAAGCRNAMFLSMVGTRDLKRYAFAAAISLLLLATVSAQLPATWLAAVLVAYLLTGMLWLHLPAASAFSFRRRTAVFILDDRRDGHCRLLRGDHVRVACKADLGGGERDGSRRRVGSERPTMRQQRA